MSSINHRYERDIIYTLKFFAIISVISAHCGNRWNNNVIETTLNQGLMIFGTFGVPIFFIISGMLFHVDTDLTTFSKRKLINIVIPWVFTGSVIWIYEYMKNGIEYTGPLINWLIGSRTYLWYMTTLMIYYFIFYFIRKNRSIYILLFLGIVFRLFKYTMLPLFGMDFKIPILLNYILGQLLFFSVGFYFQHNKLRFMTFYEKYWNNKKLLVYCFLSIMISTVLAKGKINYNSSGFSLFIFGLAPLLFIFSKFMLSHSFSRHTIAVGKESFAIYLLHMPFAGLLSNIFSRFAITRILVFLQPIIVLALVSLAIFLTKNILKRLNMEKFNKLLGIRNT